MSRGSNKLLRSLPVFLPFSGVLHRGSGGRSAAGVITRAAVRCVPSSTAVNTLLLQLSCFADVQPVFELANKHLAEVLSAFEFLDAQSMRLALKHVHGATNPFSDISNMYVLLETAGAPPPVLHS